MLTGITDENGNSYASWTYDGFGRCTMSEHAGGADEVQVSYNDSTGTTDGDQPARRTGDLYACMTIRAYRRSPLSTAPLARLSLQPRAYFTYDTNGYLATATDWNGNSTHYTNNSHGEPTIDHRSLWHRTGADHFDHI